MIQPTVKIYCVGSWVKVRILCMGHVTLLQLLEEKKIERDADKEIAVYDYDLCRGLSSSWSLCAGMFCQLFD